MGPMVEGIAKDAFSLPTRRLLRISESVYDESNCNEAQEDDTRGLRSN